MVNMSFSTDVKTFAKISEFQTTEGHKSWSAAVNQLVKYGFIYMQILEEQDKLQTTFKDVSP